jgi:two-component system sensor histidine kinase DegS
MRKDTEQLQSDRHYGDHSDHDVTLKTRELDRRDLTRELHDTVIQPLTSLLISFTQIERQMSSAGLIEAHLGMWKELAQEALDSLRSSLADIQEPSHRTNDLAGSLRRNLALQTHAQDLRVSLESHDWPTDLPPVWCSHLYLAVREAVTNVKKHAHATEVTILLHADPTDLTITIQDNGVGFPQADQANVRCSPPGYGLGLKSIRDRVMLLGGQMALSTAPSRGVQMVIQLPRPEPINRLIPSVCEREDATHN